jgi:peptide-methionine (S)-S-oxide reductase
MKRALIIAALAGGVALLAFVIGADAGDHDTESAAAKESNPTSVGDDIMINNPNYRRAMFGAGCFWGVEETFRQTKGVKETEVGFAGGTMDHPSYKDVCTKNTGHAEVVQLVYDPSVVSYDDLLKVFWDNHDPTQLDRQGPDVGDQYRSVIFYYNDDQKAEALASKKALEESGKYKRPIVTQVVAAPTFWKAEEYHQRYLEKHGLSTCRIK